MVENYRVIKKAVLIFHFEHNGVKSRHEAVSRTDEINLNITLSDFSTRSKWNKKSGL